MFLAQLLRDNITKVEETPVDMLHRFASEEMRSVFTSCIWLLQNSMRISKSKGPTDLKTQKLEISVALLALELQIKIKQVFLPKAQW